MDLVICAEGLSDGEWKDYSSQFFLKGVTRLSQAAIAVLMLEGDCDAASKITRTPPWSDNVCKFDTLAPQSFAPEALGLVLYGQWFNHLQCAMTCLWIILIRSSGRSTLGYCTASLDGRLGHVNYAPCTVAELKQTHNFTPASVQELVISYLWRCLIFPVKHGCCA